MMIDSFSLKKSFGLQPVKEVSTNPGLKGRESLPQVSPGVGSVERPKSVPENLPSFNASEYDYKAGASSERHARSSQGPRGVATSLPIRRVTRPELVIALSASKERAKVSASMVTSPRKITMPSPRRVTPTSTSLEPLTFSASVLEESDSFKTKSSSVTVAASVKVSSSPHRAKFLPTGPNEFRRELSEDHPLLGGEGKYHKEKSEGLAPATAARPQRVVKEVEVLEKLTSESKTRAVDPNKLVEQLRKNQTEELSAVLEDERQAEVARENALKRVSGAEAAAEKAKLDAIFGEERRRASERILRLTKDHERQLRSLVLSASGMSTST